MLSNIELKHFRSYNSDSFEFTDGVNIIVGPNASGKSNLLEAILVIAHGSSYRAADKSVTSYIFDEKPYARLTYHHTLPVVLFEPNNLLLLHGQPDMRRLYMDDLLEQLEPGFGSTRKHYRRVLSQRNSLLKRQPHDIEQQIFVWNVRLSELGGYIARARIGLIEKLNQKLADLYQNIAQTKTIVTAVYESRLPFDTYETTLLHTLESSLSTDIIRGFTAVGPHRDDLVLRFNAVPSSETASRGETRTALLALKVFELGLLEEVRGQKPLLLLDDVFSELDGKRRHALTDYLQTHQTFITTTDADIIGKKFASSSHVIAIGS
jgi:DNA replication and repair protein RecF